MQLFDFQIILEAGKSHNDGYVHHFVNFHLTCTIVLKTFSFLVKGYNFFSQELGKRVYFAQITLEKRDFIRFIR